MKQEIDNWYYKEDNKWKGNKIKDSNCFLFSLYSNGRSNEMKKFPIKFEQREHSFTLNKKESPILFSVGEKGDLCIKKEKTKGKCFCDIGSFEYETKENEKLLIGKNGKNVFF